MLFCCTMQINTLEELWGIIHTCESVSTWRRCTKIMAEFGPINAVSVCKPANPLPPCYQVSIHWHVSISEEEERCTWYSFTEMICYGWVKWKQWGKFTTLELQSMLSNSNRPLARGVSRCLLDTLIISIFSVYNAMGCKGIGYPIHPKWVFLDTQF